MSVRVTTNISALFALVDLAKNQRELSDAAIHLASGVRITKAADDTYGLAISHHLTSQINGMVQAVANAHDATAVAGIADGALATVQDTLQRMRQLILLAANAGAGSPDSLATISREVGALTQLLDAIAEFTAAGDKRLLDGSYRATFQVGPSGGNIVILDLSTADMHAGNLGGSANGGGINLSQLAIFALDDSDGIYTVNGIKADLAALSESIVAVSDKRSTLGAVANQLDDTVANLGAAISAVSATRSTLTDADMAAQAQRFVAAHIKSFAAASVVAQANSTPEAVLRLLDDSAVAPSEGSTRRRVAGRTDTGHSSSGAATGAIGTRSDASAPAAVREHHRTPDSDRGENAAAPSVELPGNSTGHERIDHAAPSGDSSGDNAVTRAA